MKQGSVSVKYSEENSVFREVSYQYFFNFFLGGKGNGVGWEWALINFFCL